MQMGCAPAGTKRTLSVHLYRSDPLSSEVITFQRTE